MTSAFAHDSQSTTPASQSDSWRFAHLSAADILPLLQRHLRAQDSTAQWQLCWLHNNGQPVIALLPKVSWHVYPSIDQNSTQPHTQSALYRVVKTCRDIDLTAEDASHVALMSYPQWQAELIAYSQGFAHQPPDSTLSANDSDNARYYHGLIGFIGYDIAARALSPDSAIDLADQPCAVIGHYDIYLTLSDTGAWQLQHIGKAGYQQATLALLQTLRRSLDYLDAALSRSCQDDVTMATYPPSYDAATLNTLSPVGFTPTWHQQDYQSAFTRTQQYLHQGDCYQVNLAQRWCGYRLHTHHGAANPTTAEPSTAKPIDKHNQAGRIGLIDYLPTLHRHTAAPFAGYLQTQGDYAEQPQDDGIAAQYRAFELLSCSPELLFSFTTDPKTGERHMCSKPIKGTLPRGATKAQDHALKQQLVDSDKDRSENVMIVDLLRNDLGKYAVTGSVHVPQLFAIESFSNVHHMVSTITATLRPDTHPLTVLFGSLPAGSITGTPKKRAVEVIAEVEAAPRGAYCGTMGYMNFDGSGQWNVLIRTLQATHRTSDAHASQETSTDDAPNTLIINSINKAISEATDQPMTLGNDVLNAGKREATPSIQLWAGGAVTVASSQAAEYQECLDKVGNLLALLEDPNGLSS